MNFLLLVCIVDLWSQQQPLWGPNVSLNPVSSVAGSQSPLRHHLQRFSVLQLQGHTPVDRRSAVGTTRIGLTIWCHFVLRAWDSKILTLVTTLLASSKLYFHYHYCCQINALMNMLKNWLRLKKLMQSIANECKIYGSLSNNRMMKF